MTAIRQRAWWAIGAIAATLVVFGMTDVAIGAGDRSLRSSPRRRSSSMWPVPGSDHASEF